MKKARKNYSWGRYILLKPESKKRAYKNDDPASRLESAKKAYKNDAYRGTTGLGIRLGDYSCSARNPCEARERKRQEKGAIGVQKR